MRIAFLYSRDIPNSREKKENENFQNKTILRIPNSEKPLLLSKRIYADS